MRRWRLYPWLLQIICGLGGSGNKKIVKSSHYYLYSAFNNANCVKAALHQLDIKLGGFTSALQYLDGEIVCRNSVILLWPDKISSLNLGCSIVRSRFSTIALNGSLFITIPFRADPSRPVQLWFRFPLRGLITDLFGTQFKCVSSCRGNTSVYI